MGIKLQRAFNELAQILIWWQMSNNYWLVETACVGVGECDGLVRFKKNSEVKKDGVYEYMSAIAFV